MVIPEGYKLVWNDEFNEGSELNSTDWRHEVQKVIVLADSSKFGRRGFSKICDMSAVDQIITDDKAPASVIERLQESGVDVTVVPVGRRE